MAGKKSTQEVRIIGGKWKGRKLRFDGDSSLRPTLGRIRETLFNWLRSYIHDLTCLDLFAGSGVLGLEALSQGAASCVFVDSNQRTIHALEQNISQLQAQDRCQVVHGDAQRYLRQQSPNSSSSPSQSPSSSQGYDLVLLDPPFDSPELLADTLRAVADQRLARQFIYLESSSMRTLVAACESIDTVAMKQTRAGVTHAALLQLD